MATPNGDRIFETTTTQGTGAVTLAGAESGYQSFNAAAGGADITGIPYVISMPAAGVWEVGYGNYVASSNTLQRNTIIDSSNGGAAVNLPAGTKNVHTTVPADEVMLKRDDLDGLASVSTARTNLGLGSIATQDEGTGGGDFRDNSANDSRFSQIGVLAAPAGTGLLQTDGSVPTGWTRQNETEDFVYIGCKSGETVGAVAGTWNHATGLTTASVIITTTLMESHAHNIPIQSGAGGDVPLALTTAGQTNGSTSFVGSGAGHTHTVSSSSAWRPRNKRAARITKN